MKRGSIARPHPRRNHRLGFDSVRRRCGTGSQPVRAHVAAAPSGGGGGIWCPCAQVGARSLAALGIKYRNMRRLSLLALLLAAAAHAQVPKEADFNVKDFRFRSGETLPEVRIHYAT